MSKAWSNKHCNSMGIKTLQTGSPDTSFISEIQEAKLIKIRFCLGQLAREQATCFPVDTQSTLKPHQNQCELPFELSSHVWILHGNRFTVMRFLRGWGHFLCLEFQKEKVKIEFGSKPKADLTFSVFCPNYVSISAFISEDISSTTQTLLMTINLPQGKTHCIKNRNTQQNYLYFLFIRQCFQTYVSLSKVWYLQLLSLFLFYLSAEAFSTTHGPRLHTPSVGAMPDSHCRRNSFQQRNRTRKPKGQNLYLQT